MFCRKCGTQLPDDARVCSNCKTPVRRKNTEGQEIRPVQPQIPETAADYETELVGGGQREPGAAA
ncbi:MAG: zinc-ribbon domain-containing protein, partial [Clostridium sp.]|nr:zinc-ribbon domain-containing protein [Clostridium sp.]